MLTRTLSKLISIGSEKKINEIFKDDKFILNNKDGYHL